MAPVVEAVQAMRGVGLIVAVTVIAEVGDFSRFANPRQLMAYRVRALPVHHRRTSAVGLPSIVGPDAHAGSGGGRGLSRPMRRRISACSADFDV